MQTNDQNGTSHTNHSSSNNSRTPLFQSPLKRKQQQQQKQQQNLFQQQQDLLKNDNDQNGETSQTQRRESIVKPTWQNVCPGEVPYDTLEKLNQLSNGQQQQVTNKELLTIPKA